MRSCIWLLAAGISTSASGIDVRSVLPTLEKIAATTANLPEAPPEAVQCTNFGGRYTGVCRQADNRGGNRESAASAVIEQNDCKLISLSKQDDCCTEVRIFGERGMTNYSESQPFGVTGQPATMTDIAVGEVRTWRKNRTEPVIRTTVAGAGTMHGYPMMVDGKATDYLTKTASGGVRWTQTRTVNIELVDLEDTIESVETMVCDFEPKE